MSKKIIEISSLSKQFNLKNGVVSALDEIDLSIFEGETLGLVGESGSGKSTLAKLILNLIRPNKGSIIFEDSDLSKLASDELKKVRQKIQIVFQDPYSSLNPRLSVEAIIREPLDIHKIQDISYRKKRVIELLNQVRLSDRYLTRYPHQLSGGERQRVSIARALALSPKFIALDESVSALDVSVQAQIILLLQKLQKEKNLTYLFISHDLRVVRLISKRIAVMYLGQIVELGPSDLICNEPLHPYTKALISSVFYADPEKEKKRKPIFLKGEVPSPFNRPKGCPFCTRCPLAKPICFEKRPPLKKVSSKRKVACHLVDERREASFLS